MKSKKIVENILNSAFGNPKIPITQTFRNPNTQYLKLPKLQVLKMAMFQLTTPDRKGFDQAKRKYV
jgi:hypothetical protein